MHDAYVRLMNMCMQNVRSMVKSDLSTTTCNQILAPGDIMNALHKQYKLDGNHPIHIREGKDNWVVVNSFVRHKNNDS